MNRDARMSAHGLRQGRAFEADKIHVDVIRRQGMRVVQHAGTASKISQRDDSGSHQGTG